MTDMMIKTAFRHLNHKSRVLAPASKAEVIFPEFDAAHPNRIAIVRWPALVNFKEVIFTHVIHDGDAI